MLRTIKRSLVIAVIAVSGVFASVGTAHAASVSRMSLHAVSTPNIQGLTKAKNSNVLPRGKRNFKFNPKAIKVPDCSNPKVTLSFTVTNDSSISQQLEVGGSPLGSPVAPGGVVYVCASSGGSGGSVQVTLASSTTAVLTVTVVH
jgi:hypothetical protein